MLGNKKPANRNTFYLVLPLFIGFLISIVILNYFSTDSLENQVNFDELALGEDTSLYLAQVDNIQVHCHNLEDASHCIDGYNKKSEDINDDVILWLGNSQLHSINQMKTGDETATPILHRNIINLKKYFMTFSQPNANLQEHYLLFEYLSSRLPVSTLILPMVFDDLRETGIRSSLKEAFDNEVSKRLQRTEIGLKLISTQADKDAAGNDMAALDNTVQERSEKYLNSLLVDSWGVWGQRSNLRGNIFGNLYIFRNWLFGITPSSVRRVIPGRYTLNIQAMKATLDSAQEQGVQVLLYIVPLRNDVAIPYDLQQYEKFKSEVEAAAHGDHVKFIDAGDLVPAEFWGTKDATTIGGEQELDFMHFQASGHILLADKIFNELKILWGLN